MTRRTAGARRGSASGQETQTAIIPLEPPGPESPTHRDQDGPGCTRGVTLTLGHNRGVRARSAVFDLYGDHLAGYGYWAPISAVVALLRACGVQPAATRTAVSRMVGQGWLEPQERAGIRGYLAGATTRDRLTAAHTRIYDTGPVTWDSCWHLVVLARPDGRAQRDRAAATLGYLGYGRLTGQTWLAPRRNAELGSALQAAGVWWEEFEARHPGDPVDLVARVWDLRELAERYTDFALTAAALRSSAGGGMPPERAYPVRAGLVHRWRSFLFLDPGLPPEVLPADWPGGAARTGFLDVAELLAPAARIFVRQTMAAAGVNRTGAAR